MSTSCNTPDCTADRVTSSPRLLQILKWDRVLTALAASLIGLTLYDHAQAWLSINFTAAAVWEILPFLVLAVAIAAGTKASGADALVARAFSGHPLKSVAVAALFGALSPFCSCGVVPLIAALLSAGVPLAPVMAFWIASPIMDPEMFVLTAAGIGIDFAIAKTFATVGMGMLAGGAVYFLERGGRLQNPLSAALSCDSGCGPTSLDARPHWKFWRESARLQIFQNEARSTAAFLGKWLTLAFFIESLMLAWLPAESIVSAVGGDAWYVIPLAAMVGVPAYLNGYAAIPLVGGLMEMGMAPGAAMAFITAGAVSSIPAAIAVHALVRGPVFFIYLGLGLSGSMLSGVIYQWLRTAL